MYFRITGYHPTKDISFILDCNGKFEKLWQFSVFVISKGCKVIEVSTEEKFIDVSLKKAEFDSEHIFLLATQKGSPEYVPYEIDGRQYSAVRIGKHLYISDKTAT